jgi:microcin C transport system permease protein
VDPKRLEQIKALYGFDKPAHERFLQMLGQFARFDLGKSFFQNKDVWQLVKEKLPVSISLGLWTFFISYLVAVPLGVAKAVRAGSRFDLVTTLLILVGYAIPGFVLGVALLVIFGGQLQWFPLRGLTSPTGKNCPGARASWTTCGTSPCPSSPWCWAALP